LTLFFLINLLQKKAGFEENVLCKNSKIKNIPDKYFDHDYRDNTTKEFFDIQKKKNTEFSRDYLYDIYHIIDAVERGWGKAVIPKHLINKNSKIEIIKGFKKLDYPVYLSYPDLPYYSEPMKKAIELLSNIKEYLL